MNEYISIKLELKGKGGSSVLEFEGLEYEEAKERVYTLINFIYRRERFANVRIEGNDREIKFSQEFEKLSYSEAKERVNEFLKFIYKIEEKLPTVKESWLSMYDIENLSQKDRLFLILKHNHPNEWVRSQDIKEEYEILFGEPINLSSVSTYLARFYESGLTERRGSRAQREYRLITS